MDGIRALEQAACIEFSLGAGADRARVECFAVPCRKGAARRSSRWVFLVVTDLPETDVRDGLHGFQVERLGKRQGLSRYAAWPSSA